MKIDFSRVVDPTWPWERCGVVDEHGHVIELVNHSNDPANRFQLIGNEAVTALSSTESDLYAVWHTHPPGSPVEPSGFDLELLPEGVLGIVVHVTSGKQTRYVKGRVLDDTEG